MALLASTLPLELLLALTQQGRDGASLRDLAQAAKVRDSSAQHAIAVLLEDGVAAASGASRERRYHLAETDVTSHLVPLALHYLPRAQALGALVRANAGVEFASYRGADGELFVVYTNDADAADEVRLRDAVARSRAQPHVRLRAARHDQVIEELMSDPALRAHALSGNILKGRPERSLPDRSRQGDFEHARRLGRPHPTLGLPSQRRLAALARRYGLAHLGLFGSAVREDFRPDSDVDVLVRYRPNVRKRVADVLGLEDELEKIFDRDVDLVDAEALDERTRRRVTEEEVAFPLGA